MRGTVVVPFVDEVRGLYMAEGIEVEVPEDRVAELARWMRFKETKAEEKAEAPKKRKATKKK